MSFIFRTVVSLLLTLQAGAMAFSSDPVVVGLDSDRWQIADRNARIEDHLGRKSLYLRSGYAFLKDVEFENGVVEVDVAAPNLRSFLGIVFRFESESDHEIVYFRPHKSGLEDAVQYTPSFNGAGAWQLYSGRGSPTRSRFPRNSGFTRASSSRGSAARCFSTTRPSLSW